MTTGVNAILKFSDGRNESCPGLVEWLAGLPDGTTISEAFQKCENPNHMLFMLTAFEGSFGWPTLDENIKNGIQNTKWGYAPL